MVVPVEGFSPSMPHPDPTNPLNNGPDLHNGTDTYADLSVPGRVDELASGLGLNLLDDVNDSDRLFELSEGTPLGFVVCEKSYESSDPYIQGSPVRKKISTSLLQKSMGKALRWREKAGLLHLGAGVYTFLPLAQFHGLGLGAYFGFSTDVGLRYRTLQPELYNRLISKGATKKAPDLTIPFTAKRALKMPAGSEFEIVGAVRAEGNAGLYLYAGQAMGPALFGGALFAQGGVEIGKDIGLSVLALDNKGHVRLTIRRITETESNLSVGVAAGCIIQLSQAMGANTNAYTEILPANRSTRDYLDGVSAWTTATLGMSHAVAKGKTSLVSFDLDLHSEAGKRIYRDVLLLRVDAALCRAQKNPECASVALSSELQKGSTLEAGINFFTETFSQDSENHDQSKGQMTLRTGEVVSYGDKSITKKQSMWLLWKREVKWQEVKVSSPEGSLSRSFFRFHFGKDHFRFSANNFYQFLRFADGLGIPREGLIPEDANEVSALEDKLAKAAKVSTDFDVFFTEAGICKMMTASSFEAQQAYIHAARATDFDYADTPIVDEGELGIKARQKLDEYKRYMETHFWDVLQLTPQTNRHFSEYNKLTGRNLSLDYGLYKQAQSFATLLRSGHQKKDGSQCAAGVFLKLATKNKFDFEKTIAALVQLAGRGETRIHAFSLESYKTKLEYESEAELDHPRDDVAAQLMSLD